MARWLTIERILEILLFDKTQIIELRLSAKSCCLIISSIVRIILIHAILLRILSALICHIGSLIPGILLVPVGWLQIGRMTERILLELLTIDALYYLRLLTSSWRELLTIITQIILHCIHVLL